MARACSRAVAGAVAALTSIPCRTIDSAASRFDEHDPSVSPRRSSSAPASGMCSRM
jgi:hypothetical protein